MGFDIALGDLVGSLFFGGEAAAAAAPEAIGAAADLGLTGADLGAAAGLGAADLLPGAGLAADIGAGAGAAAGAGATAADVAGAGIGAADLGAAAGAAGAGLAGEAVSPAIDIATAGSLGDTIGAGAENALAAAPSNFNEQLALSPGMFSGTSAAGGASTVPGVAPAALAGPSEAANVAGATVSPAAELAGSPNIEAALGGAGTGAAPVTEASTAQTAFSGAPVPFQDTPFSAASPAAATGGSIPQDASAALASAPASPAGGGGITDQLSGALNSPYLKAAELGLPLAFLGKSLIQGPQPIPPQSQLAVQNAETQLAPLQAKAAANTDLFNSTAATDLNLANNFQISPAQAASIATWKQNQYNQLFQQIANQGNTDPTKTSEWVQGKNQIDQQALAQQVQMINQLISTAFQASSAANAGVSTAANVTSQLDSTLMQAGQLQVQQDQNFQNAVGSALQSFGLVAALSGRFGKTQTGATA
jgi:hypothetical protein